MKIEIGDKFAITGQDETWEFTGFGRFEDKEKGLCLKFNITSGKLKGATIDYLNPAALAEALEDGSAIRI